MKTKLDEIKSLINEIIDLPVESKGINYELLNLLISSYLGEELVYSEVDENFKKSMELNDVEFAVLKIAKKFLIKNSISIAKPSFNKKRGSGGGENLVRERIRWAKP